MNKLSLYFPALVAVVLLASSCKHGRCVTGSGNQISQNRSVEPFTRVEASGALKIVLKQDSSPAVQVVADDNVQQIVKTGVDGGTLHIKFDRDVCNGGGVTVYVHSKKYEGLAAAGAINVSSEGKLSADNFEMDLSGNSEVNLDLNAANCKTRAEGASKIMLKGQASSHDIEITGAGELNAPDFVVSKYKLNLTGASKSFINVLTTLDIDASGASEVSYKGNPATVNNNSSGATQVKKVQ